MNSQVSLFGINIDVLDMVAAIAQLEVWIDLPEKVCRYVVTPNVAHVVQLRSNLEFRDAYTHASLVVADGKPLVAIAHLLGYPLPGTVPGSDLVPALFNVYSIKKKRLRVFLLGAGPGVAQRAASNIEEHWKPVRIVGTYSPPLGFEYDADECRNVCRRVAESACDVLVVGLGAPKQELWVKAHTRDLKVKVALCVGATIDFLAGEKPRAPRWMRAIGLEWLHRVMTEPRRLAKRYAHDAIVFPWLCWKEWKSQRRLHAGRETRNENFSVHREQFAAEDERSIDTVRRERRRETGSSR